MSSVFGKQVFKIKGLFEIDKPTEGGNVYTFDTVMKLMEIINSSAERITIQEMNVPERLRDKIPPYQPIPSRTMAYLLSAELNGNSLDVTCETKPSRDGRKLVGIMSTVGIDNIHFIPVGYGYPDANGCVTNYTLKYVSIEPISAI